MRSAIIALCLTGCFFDDSRPETVCERREQCAERELCVNHFCQVRDGAPATEMSVADARVVEPDALAPDANPSGCPIGARCLVPSDDTYIDQARPETSYGDLPALVVAAEPAGERWVLLRFDLAELSAAPARAELALRLSRADPVDTGRGARVHLVGVFWDQLEMTWNDKPAVSAPDVATGAVTAPVGGRQAWDVTGVLQAAVADGRSQLAFAIQVDDGDGAVVWTFVSREGGASPWLVVE